MNLVWKHQNIFPEAALQQPSLGKGVLKICSKFTGKHPCRSVISIKLQSNFIEITFQHGYSICFICFTGFLETQFPVIFL